MPTGYVPNPGWEQALTRDGAFLAFLGGAAGQIASSAKGIAPVDEGDYYDSIEGHAEVDGAEGIGVVSAAGEPPELAIYLEFGTGNPGPTEAFAPLRRAAEGYRV